MDRDGIEWNVLCADTVVTVAGPLALAGRPRAVLLRLLLEPNLAVSSRELAEFLWGDHPPMAARNSVARFVADLRRSLAGHRMRIVTSAHGYTVVVHQGELDWDRAASALEGASRSALTDDRACRHHLTLALELVGRRTNPLFIDLPLADRWVRREAELRLAILELYADLQLRDGRHRELVTVLEDAVALHPHHEQLWTQLMAALHRSGRSTDAVRASRRLAGLLAEVGMQPSDRVRRLEDDILHGREGSSEVL